MEYLLVFIPLIITAIVVVSGFYFGRIDKGFPVPVLFIPSFLILLVITAMSQIMRHDNFTDAEYRSYYYTKIRHTDRWDEYIHRTCTREVPDGTDSEGRTKYKTETYDCSYVETHPERWIIYDNMGNDYYCDEEDFNKVKNLWKVPSVFVDMHRDYYSIDGDAQDYYWDNNRGTIVTFTEEHTYENRLLGSGSAYNFMDIGKDEAKKLGLYEYPEIKGKYLFKEQNPILGYKIGPGNLKRYLAFNALEGKTRQMHLFVLVFPDSCGVRIAQEQQAYWKGGNKNEFIICIGLNKKTGIIAWAYTFSWQYDTTLDVKCRQWLTGNGKHIFDPGKLMTWIENNKGLWKRREFKEFEYIDSYLTKSQMTTIIWTVCILSIISGIILIMLIWTPKN